MSENPYKLKTEEVLALADIKINGSRPWDIKVTNDDFYQRVMSQGSIGLGESYMDGWWDAAELDSFFYKLLSVPEIEKSVKVDLATAVMYAKAKILNMQTKARSTKVAKQHYDLGNSFYEKMLDKRMQYTCAYWKDAKTLDEAQENKLDLICKKAQLKPGEKVLELGCGWGWFAKYAAEKYGVSVKAYNISEEQVKYGREISKGLPVEIILADYREAEGLFDKVVSVGLCEHVGYRNYPEFMETAYRCLKDKGLFVLHTIGGNESTTEIDPWMDKYIFPNAMLPSIKQLAEASEGFFVMEDWHNLSTNYDKTLLAWYENFNRNWPQIKGGSFDDRFYRMWKYYLMASAGGFRSRRSQLWQVVYSKGVLEGGYQSVR